MAQMRYRHLIGHAPKRTLQIDGGETVAAVQCGGGQAGRHYLRPKGQNKARG